MFPQNKPTAGGILALLDLPIKSVLNLNGETVILKRDDFVAVHSIPTTSAGFQLATIRGSSCRGSSGVSGVTVGFALLWDDETSDDAKILVRRYDPFSEEVSSESVDDGTAINLVQQILQGKIDLQRISSYHQLVSQERNDMWLHQTKFVSRKLLQRRGIVFGGKIVPGAFEDGVDESHEGATSIVDGSAVRYPPIPVLSQATARHTLHDGTKRFLKELEPAQRTVFFMAPNPSSLALEHLLTHEYDHMHQDMLGDVQLSYVMFLNLHCFASLSHWRDLVAMLSAVDQHEVTVRGNIYASFLDVLLSQVSSMEDDFFDDAEFSGDNCLVPAFRQLTRTARAVVVKDDHSMLGPALDRFTKLLHDKFPYHFEAEPRVTIVENDEPMQVDGSDDDDSDGPVLVALEEVEASMTRSSLEDIRSKQRKEHWHQDDHERHSSALRAQYPLLFAAMQDQEDVLMTCARALDEAVDVSLVREAAAYLEEVETIK